MNVSTDTKTKIKVFAAILTFLVLSIPRVFAQDASSSSVTDLQSQENTLQSQLDGINSKIESYQNQIAQEDSQADTLQDTINLYDSQIAVDQLQMQAQQTQIDNANLQVTETQNLIAQQEQEIANNKLVLTRLIQQLNEYDDDYALQTTLTSGDLSNFLDNLQYTSSYDNQVDQVTEKIEGLKTQLQQQQKTLQTNLAALEQQQQNLQVTQATLTDEKTQEEQLLTETQGSERNYEKLVASSQSDASDLQQEVDDLDNQVKAKLGDKAEPAGKGLLDWPVNGVITQGYGNTGFTALGYNFHNGLDIAGPAGAPVYAAADGTVYDTDESNAEYGNWVAIEHPAIGIVTLYGHMRSFIVKPGQTVRQGDLIGYEGNTGNTTRLLYGPEHGYHVHFGVYDVDGFGVETGAYTKIYGPYKVPYGSTYDPLDYLVPQ